ncbi:MAG TPA: single-stranded DNA-binding protein [Bryobacteraceae bacterium]|jgi:single-strand DNA-binding protein|nr:single-stranded DNA-binding protein [Bryobacteraceae bacterium]
MQKNRIELAGYLANKPEARFLPSGTKVANARLKESYKFQGGDGKQQTHSNWHSLVFYGDVADIALSLEKDDNIHVEGSIQQRKFTPADGVSRTSSAQRANRQRSRFPAATEALASVRTGASH